MAEIAVCTNEYVSAVEQVDLASQISHRFSVQSHQTVEDVYKVFQEHQVEYLAVLEGGRLLGLCARGRVGFLLGARYGYAIYSRQPIGQHLIDSSIRLVRGMPLREALQAVLSRSVDIFYDDVLLTDPDGRFLGIMSVQTFVRLQSQLVAEKIALLEQQQEAMQAKNGELTEITRELHQANAELANARDAAFESTRLKSIFLANMSHEIRTPMNGVVGMIDLLLGTELTTEQRDYAETISSSAQALLTVINDILDFSKIEAGKVKIAKEDFDLRQLVEDTMELLAQRAQEKGLLFYDDIEEAVPALCRGDADRLRQVLNNLLGNAIKFTEQGEVRLEIHLEQDLGGEVVLRFQVTDTGIGIGPEEQSLLFQAFSQADGSSTRKFGGTGLGLAICKQLVELMNGNIGLQSTPGQGSTFWFTVVLEKRQQLAAPNHPLPPGMRILVASPQPALGRIIKQHLLSWNLRADVAPTPEEVWMRLQAAAVANDQYEVILLDRQQTSQDGLDLAERIRLEQSFAPIRLVLMVPLIIRLSAASLRQANIAACLHLPFRQRALLKVLAPAEDPSPRRSSPPSAAPSRPLKVIPARPMRILLAEDNLVNQKVALLQIRKLGYQADIAKNGLEVLAALPRQNYDVILMDCQMPEMDGFEAARVIRRQFPDLPVRIIALTANALQGDREKCLSAGMDDYLSKPMDIAQLKTALEKGHPARPAAEDCEVDGNVCSGSAFPSLVSDFSL